MKADVRRAAFWIAVLAFSAACWWFALHGMGIV